MTNTYQVGINASVTPGREIQHVGATLGKLNHNPGPKAPTLETIAQNDPLKVPEAATGSKVPTGPYGEKNGILDVYL